MTKRVLFTLDIDPSFPWRSDILGLQEFLMWLNKACKINDCICLMHFSGYAIRQMLNNKELIDNIKSYVRTGNIEIGNHGFTHLPLSLESKDLTPRHYISSNKVFEAFQNMIRIRSSPRNFFHSIYDAKKLFLTKHNGLDEKAITEEIRKSNLLIQKVFGKQPKAFRAPFFATSKLVSDIIFKEGIIYDLSNFIEKSCQLSAIEPRKIKRYQKEFWEIDTSIKIDPSNWIENITTYKAGILPDGLSVLVSHPWEFSSAYKHSKKVKKKFKLILKEADQFCLIDDIIKES